MQNGAANHTNMMFEYLKSLSLRKFAASGAKRAISVSTEYVLVRMFVPSALASSFTYLATSTAGTLGKNIVSYGFRASSQQNTEVMIAIPEEELDNLKKNLQNETNWQFNLSSIANHTSDKIKSAAVGTCTNVLNLTYQDMSEGTGALLGSTTATAGMLYFIGPPSLVALPLYLLFEGSAKSIGAFFGKYFGRYYIGPSIFKPALKSLWHALMKHDSQAIEQCIAQAEYQFREISIEQGDEDEELVDLFESWILLEPEFIDNSNTLLIQNNPPILNQKFLHPFVIVPNYKGESREEITDKTIQYLSF